MTEIIDISVPVHPGMITWAGEMRPEVELVSSIAAGDGYNLSRLVFGSHTGTHVDAPLHFLERAAPVDTLSLDALVGPVLVVDARTVAEEIGAEVVARDVPAGTERVIFATRNSELWDRDAFTDDFVAVSPDAAASLLERGVRLVGIDYLSVGPFETHRALLSEGVVLLEGLDLRGVAAGSYNLACLPLAIVGCDGAPARAVLGRL